MKKHICLLITLIILILFPKNVYAICDLEYKNKLNSMANQVVYDYDVENFYPYDDDVPSEDQIPFKRVVVSFYNLTDDLKIQIRGVKKDYLKATKNDPVVKFYYTDYQAGSEAAFSIYADDMTCEANAVREVSFVIPYINPHHEKEICKNVKSFYLCGKFVSSEFDAYLTDDELKDRVSEYKETIKKDEPSSEKVLNTFQKIIKFLLSYYYIFIIIIVSVVGYTIYYKNRYEKRGL